MNKNQKNIIAIILPLATFLIALKLASSFSSDYEDDRNPFLFDTTWWIWLTWIIGCGYFELNLFSDKGLVFPNINDKTQNISTDVIVKKGLSFLLIGGVLLIFAFIPFYSIFENNYLFAYIYTVFCYVSAYYIANKREIGTNWAFIITLFITPIISFIILLTSPKINSTTHETKIVFITRIIISILMVLGGVTYAYFGWQEWQEFQITYYANLYWKEHNQVYHLNELDSEKVLQSVISHFLRGFGLFITGAYLISIRRYSKNTL
jgi:hypothetical protein